ncbi:hypothetical protein [Ferrimicrobium acidiphilum]|uniref:hypothetical protein n=1 Tax=Ferrimicrobium acidiphilum TaxID=121039 RepID=UPI0023F165F8|nr:hypothetical protein [Ferrimicrobium acidiphilum]
MIIKAIKLTALAVIALGTLGWISTVGIHNAEMASFQVVKHTAGALKDVVTQLTQRPGASGTTPKG